MYKRADPTDKGGREIKREGEAFELGAN